jgi:hypothetical protein
MTLVPLLNPKFAIEICRTVCANFGFGALDAATWLPPRFEARKVNGLLTGGS